MKKPSLSHFLIIFGLLVLCVMTLLAVYATVPKSSIILLEEDFNSLDESKWKEEISECTEDGDQFHYENAGEENRFSADGVLRISPNLTNTEIYTRRKRESPVKCSLCLDSNNPNSGCVSSLFSANLETKNAFEVESGKLEIRAKLWGDGWMRFRIKMGSNQITAKQVFENFEFESLAEETTNVTSLRNHSRELAVIFETNRSRNVLKSEIPDNEFHTYEIEWNSGKISLKMDNKQIQEKMLKLTNNSTESLNATEKLNSTATTQPLYLNVGVDLERDIIQEVSPQPNDKRFFGARSNIEGETFFEIDFVRLFRVIT